MRPAVLVLLLLQLLCLLAAPASATPALDSARVRVAVTHQGQPLRDALIRVSGTAASETRVPGSGTVAMLLPVPGDYRFIIAAIGYAPDTLELRIEPGRIDTTLTVELEREAEELEELIATSTRTERRVQDQPLRVEVLSREEIEEKLHMTPGDISMMLNETGGLRVQTTSPSLGGANVRVQGLRGRYTLLLADGLPLYGGQVGGLGLLQVPPMDLGQVEIIKGASSALYGSAALGGVINLISRRPPAEAERGDRELLLNLTSLAGTDAVWWSSGRISPALGYTLLGSGHRQSRRDKDGDGWTDVPGYRRVVVRPRVSWERGGHHVFLTSGLTLEEREGGTLAGSVAPDGLPFPEALRTSRLDLGAAARFLASPVAHLTVRASGMLQRHRHRFGDIREPDRHGTWFIETALSRVLGRSVLVAGAAMQGERYRSEAFSRFAYTFGVPGAFLHAELVASQRLSAALSARLDHHSRYGTFLSPRLSLLVAPGPSWSIRASAGTGFFAPTPFTEETEVTGLSRLARPTGLTAERAKSASLDLQGLVGRLEWTATAFGSLVDHAVQLVRSGSSIALANAVGPTRTYGVDLVGKFRRAPLGMTASYTYTRATEPDPENPGRRTVPLTPSHAAGIVAFYERPQRTRAGLELYYTGQQALADDPYATTSRTYLILGALAEQHLGRVRLFLNLENLTGVRQTRFAPLVRPARAPDGRWTTDAWAPLEGRVVNGGLRLAF